MVRLYADEDFPLRVVEELRKLGHDVLTAHEAGQANQGIPDADVLAFAIQLGRAVLTRNRWDYLRLHSRVRPHAGIITCVHDPDVAGQSQKTHQALLTCPSLDNQLIRIDKS
jgi:uncharacterized protein DUF5615